MTERLYPLIPTPAVDAAEGHFEPSKEAADGGYDFPPALHAQLHSARHNGRKLWETAVERQERTHSEDLDRRRDPAALHDAVDRFGGVLGQLTDALASRALPQDPAAEIAFLRDRLAELEAAGGQHGPEVPDISAESAPAPRRKPAASKATPAE